MIVTLLEKEKIFSLRLPRKKKGSYWISDWKSQEKLILIEAFHDEWIAKSTSEMWFTDEQNHRVEKRILNPCSLYSVQTTTTESCGHIIAESDICWKRYIVTVNKDIIIGRREDCDIRLDGILVSCVHARLSPIGTHWILSDENSTNGVYVNNIRIQNSCVLKPGDVIYIVGLRMIVGKGFFAIHNSGNPAVLNTDVFAPFCNRRLSKVKWKYKSKAKNAIEYYVPKTPLTIYRNNSIAQCMDIIENRKACLWNCMQNQFHFLELNIGNNIYMNLQEYSTIGVRGNTDDNIAFCKGLLLQLITYYSYADVKIIFLIKEKEGHVFKTARWLPHVWDNRKQQSFFARDVHEIDVLSAYMSNQYKKKLKHDNTSIPHYVVLGFDREMEKQWDMYGIQDRINITKILFSDLCEETIPQCDIRIELDGTSGSMICTPDNGQQEFIPDIYVKEDIDLLYLQLANTQLNLGLKNSKAIEGLMVELYVPAHEKSYDVVLPRHRRIGEMLSFIEKQIIQKDANYKVSNGDAILCDREDGIVLDIELTPEESGVLNGTRLMLI